MKLYKGVFSKLFALLFIINSCKTNSIIPNKTSKNFTLRFIGEQIIPANTTYNKTAVGGLSSIDFADGKYYAISDDKNRPIRFYELDLKFNKDSFSKVVVKKMTSIKNENKYIDPESLRFDASTNHFLWTSEGVIRKGISPAIFKISKNGKHVKTYPTPTILKVSKNKTKGPIQNGTLEGLSLSVDSNYFWVSMELPLRQDGTEPTLKKGNYPIRISKINKTTGELVYQFAYQLAAIPRDSKPSGKFIVNGVPEILEISKDQFLIIERAYASGHKDGGNTVKIYKVNCSKATDIKGIESLKNKQYKPATKTLVLNLEDIRLQLTNGVVDNIEGISFGKKLANGNQTLVLISDNNFNKFNPQLTQVIVFEVLIK